MKRINGLYHMIYDMDNIRLAFDNARKGKSRYTEVIEISKNPEPYLKEIYLMLKNKTYHTSPYVSFKKLDHHKEREIFKLPFFPDRIIHHCILQVLEPVWKKIFIRDTYASIKKRGIHDGVYRVKKALKDIENTKYCLKLDIRKFYPSINHEIIKSLIKRKIKDKDVLWLLDDLIDSANGVPIGSVPSQHFGNLDMTYFDHWIKEVMGVRYYFRYCDDMVILHSSKSYLHDLLNKISQYLSIELKHELNHKYQIFPVNSSGIDFLGYRFFHTHTLVRKSIVKRLKKEVMKIHESGDITKHNKSMMASYYGWLLHADSYYLFTKYLLPIYSKHGIKHKAFFRNKS